MVIRWPERVLEILQRNAAQENLAAPSSAEKATPSSAEKATSSSVEKATPSLAEKATPSEAGRATPSDAGRATPSDAGRATRSVAGRATRSVAGRAITVKSGDDLEDIGANGTGGTDLFEKAYEEALASESVGDIQPQGPSDQYSHCNNQDGSWIFTVAPV